MLLSFIHLGANVSHLIYSIYFSWFICLEKGKTVLGTLCRNLLGKKALLPTFLQNLKNIPIYTVHCNFQLKWTCSKIPTTFVFDNTNYDSGADYRLKTYFCPIPCTILCYDLKTLLSECMICKPTQFDVASHNQVHMYGFSHIVNLLSSAPGTALHMHCRVQRFASAFVNTQLGLTKCVKIHYF